MKYIRVLSVSIIVSVVGIFNTIPIKAVSDFYSENDIQFYDPNACDPNGEDGGSSDLVDTDSSSLPNSLGGVSGTGLTQNEIDKAKSLSKSGLEIKEGDYTGTAYGPPWDGASGMEGTGITSTGIKLDKPKYVVASDPNNRLPYGSFVYIQPNPFNWDGPFLVADTGGAFHGSEAKVDFYDWKGREHQNNWGEKNIKVTKAPQPSENSEESTSSCVCSSSGSVSLSGNDNSEKAFNFFISKGLKDFQAAGIVGNMKHESNIEPQRLQGTPVGKKTPSSSVSGNIGWGIVQWTPASKFINPANDSGKDPDSLEVQLEFLWDQLEGRTSIPEKQAGDDLKSTTTVEEAVRAFQGDSKIGGKYNGYERPADESSSLAARKAYAGALLAGGNGGSSSSTSVGSESQNSTPGCTGSPNSSGGNSVSGYTFPLSLKKNDITNWGSPWCRKNCHHDGTPAMDITKKGFGDSVTGTPILAISSGVIENQHIYQGISGCYSMQFKSDDGYMYYYTHFRKPTKQNGDKVKVGDKIAEVGERKCTGNGSDPHLHIDRGSPKGHIGGEVGNRDEGFMDLINKLYDGIID